MESCDQSSVGPTPVLRGCQFDRRIGGIEGDGVLKPAGEDLRPRTEPVRVEVLEAGLSERYAEG